MELNLKGLYLKSKYIDEELKRQFKAPNTLIPTKEEIMRRIKFFGDNDPISMSYKLCAVYHADGILTNNYYMKAEIDPFDAYDGMTLPLSKEKLSNLLARKIQEEYMNLYHNIHRKDEESMIDVWNLDNHFDEMTYPNYSPLRRHLKKDAARAKKEDDWTTGLPAVKKVETYNDRVVKVTFIDDTFTKSVCSENDHFDLDVGITICCMKRLLGKNGTRKYNDILRHVHDVMKKNENAKIEAQIAKEKEKAKKRKAELKQAVKKLKAKKEQVDIYKQAILEAHAELEKAVDPLE